MTFRTNRIRNAIERGLAGGDLWGELKDLGEEPLRSRADAEAVCWGLKQLDGSTAGLADKTNHLAGLFQKVDGRECEAFEVLQEQGTPELLRLFDLINDAEDPKSHNSDTLFLLKILGAYGTVAGTLKIIEAAKRPLQPDSWMWKVVFETFTASHPEKELLYRSFQESLPDDFMAIALLDAANGVLIQGDSMSHPFDTVEGKQRLKKWLSCTDPDEYSYAHSATAALPFISLPEQGSLLEMARNHPDIGVRLEAQWAAAKMGNAEAVERLAKHCLDWRTAYVAKHYLTELEREDAVPQEANEPSSVALAEFAQWLAHPNELGRMPDELEIVDHRELRWPPEREPLPLWLIKYRAADTTGLEDDQVDVGLVGSATFCLFDHLDQRPAEDGYALHCYWEMMQNGLIAESDVAESPEEYRTLLDQWTGPPLESLALRQVAEIAPDLAYPQRLVGVASGSLDGAPGWVMLDGPRSTWYPQSEQPEDDSERRVLNVHVGRHLLGFTGKPDRKKYLRPAQAPRSPEQIIAAYERLLAEAESADPKRQANLVGSCSIVATKLDDYAEALIATGRATQVRRAVELLARHSEYDWKLAELGEVASKCDQLDLAERLLLKVREDDKTYEIGEAMGLLAAAWCRQGRTDAAKDLMVDCLLRILNGVNPELKEETREIWFRNHRERFLQLFPEGEALLLKQGIPKSLAGNR